MESKCKSLLHPLNELGAIGTCTALHPCHHQSAVRPDTQKRLAVGVTHGERQCTNERRYLQLLHFFTRERKHVTTANLAAPFCFTSKRKIKETGNWE